MKKSEVGFGETGDFHLVLEEAELEWVVAVDGNDDALAMAGLGENVVAAFCADEALTTVLEDTYEVLTGNLLHPYSR